MKKKSLKKAKNCVAHKIKLTPPLVIEVSVPSQESER